jgi:hypothetical protein
MGVSSYIEPVLGRAAKLSAPAVQILGSREHFLNCVVVSEHRLLVSPLVQQAASVTFYFHQSHLVWPLVKGFKQQSRPGGRDRGPGLRSEGSEAKAKHHRLAYNISVCIRMYTFVSLCIHMLV